MFTSNGFSLVLSRPRQCRRTLDPLFPSNSGAKGLAREETVLMAVESKCLAVQPQRHSRYRRRELRRSGNSRDSRL